MRVLQAFGEPIASGGQEAFAMNLYRAINKDKIQFDFCTPFECENSVLKSEIIDMGGNVFAGEKSFYSRLRKISLINYYRIFLKNSRYEAIHINSGSVFNLAAIAHIAKKNGVKKVFVHSHAPGYNTLKHKISRFIFGRWLDKDADMYFACSKKAGEFKFSKKILNSRHFVIVKNGIDIKKFKYDNKKREKIRKEFGFDNNNVICNVGRFSEEKNQLFLLDIFKEYLKVDSGGKLVIIGGTGPLENEINDYVHNNKLKNNIVILKNRSDVADLLNAVDIFILPSKFEGLPVSVIEAQAEGLRVICSDAVSVEAKATDNFYTIPLQKTPNEWASIINKLIRYERKDQTASIKKNGFSIKDCAKMLENYYIDLLPGEKYGKCS